MPNREQQLAVAQEMLELATKRLGPDHGLALFVFKFGDDSPYDVTYISNADDEDMKVSLREWLDEGLLVTDDAPEAAEA